MKYYISLFVLFFTCAQMSWAQDQPRRSRPRPSEKESTPTVLDLTERAKIKSEVEAKKPSHVVWERIIYRAIDLTKEENNAALYYPVQPQGNRQNLFTLIFKLLSDGKISGYDPQGDAEVFSEEKKISFDKNILDQYQILYTQEGNRFVVDERDIPSPDVTQYMIREGYYFDQATGTFKTQALAICPILVREDFYYGNFVREKLFWLKYEDISPYLSREMIMTSNYNNALTYTIDDYFRKNMYTGEIVKTVNMMGKSLAQEVGTDPDALKHAQDSIESQLKAFDQKLWVYNDSTVLKPEKAKEKKTVSKEATGKDSKEKTSSARSRSNTQAKESSPKASSSKPAKSESASPTRSVRRSR